MSRLLAAALIEAYHRMRVCNSIGSRRLFDAVNDLFVYVALEEAKATT